MHLQPLCRGFHFRSGRIRGSTLEAARLTMLQAHVTYVGTSTASAMFSFSGRRPRSRPPPRRRARSRGPARGSRARRSARARRTASACPRACPWRDEARGRPTGASSPGATRAAPCARRKMFRREIVRRDFFSVGLFSAENCSAEIFGTAVREIDFAVLYLMEKINRSSPCANHLARPCARGLAQSLAWQPCAKWLFLAFVGQGSVRRWTGEL